jgi:uncharacterized protein YciI
MQDLPTLEEINQQLTNYPVFVILADTLDKWLPPTTDEGKKMLRLHYLWALDLQKQGKLILAGPVDHDIIAKGLIPAVGNITGLIMIKAETRQEAESIAEQDPFHTSGLRKNRVHSLNIRFGGISDIITKK